MNERLFIESRCPVFPPSPFGEGWGEAFVPAGATKHLRDDCSFQLIIPCAKVSATSPSGIRGNTPRLLPTSRTAASPCNPRGNASATDRHFAGRLSKTCLRDTNVSFWCWQTPTLTFLLHMSFL